MADVGDPLEIIVVREIEKVLRVRLQEEVWLAERRRREQVEGVLEGQDMERERGDPETGTDQEPKGLRSLAEECSKRNQRAVPPE
jgi:hypothetical protein